MNHVTYEALAQLDESFKEVLGQPKYLYISIHHYQALAPDVRKQIDESTNPIWIVTKDLP